MALGHEPSIAERGTRPGQVAPNSLVDHVTPVGGAFSDEARPIGVLIRQLRYSAEQPAGHKGRTGLPGTRLQTMDLPVESLGHQRGPRTLSQDPVSGQLAGIWPRQ